MSRRKMASTAHLPRPGQEKIVSTTTAPPNRNPNWSPISVTTGIRAGRRMCLTRTVGADRPFAYAARTKSLLITSSMFARTSRVSIAAGPMASVSAGRTR